MREVKRFKPVINNKPYRPYAYCEENSEGIYVRIDDYEAIKAERDALAAENQGLDSAIGAIADAYETGLKDLLAHEIDTAINTSTPATASFLNSVRAEGVIAVRNALVLAEDGADIYATVTQVANQLRAGIQIEGEE